MFEQIRDKLRANNKQISSLYLSLSEELDKEYHLEKRQYEKSDNAFKKQIGMQKRELSNSFKNVTNVTKAISNIARGRKSALSYLNDSIDKYLTDLDKRIKPKQNKNPLKDTTDLFLKKNNPDAQITSLLKKIDKNLTFKTSGSKVSGSSSSKDEGEDQDKSDLKEIGGIAALFAGPLAAIGGKALIKNYIKKKALESVGLGGASKVVKYGDKLLGIGGKVLNKSKTLKMVGEKVLESGVVKVGSKAAKKLIPFVGIPFAVWDLVSTVKDGYSNYSKFADAGDLVNANKAIGYTFVSSMGAVLGIIGSLAASTGIGMPIAFAIDALSLALDLYGSYLRDDTLTNVKTPEKNDDKKYSLDDKGKKALNVDDKKVPVSTTNDKISIKTNQITQPIKTSKPDKVIKDLNKKVSKNLTVEKKEPENWLDKVFGAMMKGADFLDRGVEKFTGTISDAVKSAIGGIKDPIIKEQAIRTARAESTFFAGAGKGKFQVNGNPAAGGLYQFIPSTWNKYASKYGYTMDDRFDPAKATQVYIEYQKDTNKGLQKAIGGNLSITDYYMANFLGVDGAARFLKGYRQNPNALAVNYVNEGAVANNAPIFKPGATLSDVYNIMDAKMKAGDKYIGAFSSGVDNLSKGGLALVHQGEMIIPANNASRIRSVSSIPQATSSISDDDLSEDFWINTFMVELANVVKREYLGAN